MLHVLKAFLTIGLVLASFIPTLTIWGICYYLERGERQHDRHRISDSRSFTSNAILDRIRRH